MPLSDADLDHLADLARLDVEPDARDALRDDVARLLAYVAQLQAIDVSGVEPLLRPSEVVDVLRDDVLETGLEREALEALAPGWADGRVVVPRTVDEGG
jgi:aspartyl-tRNA(Asn)/glutamyl-tRNA(Gln) amidotransferase subunit C